LLHLLLSMAPTSPSTPLKKTVSDDELPLTVLGDPMKAMKAMKAMNTTSPAPAKKEMKAIKVIMFVLICENVQISRINICSLRAP